MEDSCIFLIIAKAVWGQVEIKLRTVSAVILGRYVFTAYFKIGQYFIYAVIFVLDKTVGLRKFAVIERIEFYIKNFTVPSGDVYKRQSRYGYSRRGRKR